MPQVLYRQPTFLEQLTPQLSQIGQAVGAGLRQRQIDSKDQQIIEKLFDEDSHLTPMQIAALGMQLSKPRQEALATAMKSQTDAERFGYQKSREQRLSHEHILSSYDRAIAEKNAEIKEAFDTKERARLAKERDALKKERAVNHARLRGGGQPVFKLLEMEEEPPLMAQAAQGEQISQPIQAPMPQGQSPMQEPQSQSARQKQKFDPKNQKHIAIRDKALKQTGGNREEAQKILMEMFE